MASVPCLACDFQNRGGVLFCEECGTELRTPGGRNRARALLIVLGLAAVTAGLIVGPKLLVSGTAEPVNAANAAGAASDDERSAEPSLTGDSSTQMDGMLMPVPSLVGLPPGEARTLLDSLGLVYVYGGQVETDPDEDYAGVVYRSEPPQLRDGEQVWLPAGSTVTVYVGHASSSKDVIVPDLVGLTDLEARATADAVGLSLEFAEVPIALSPDRRRLDGLVARQAPAAGAGSSPGDVVTVWRGVALDDEESPRMVAVPDVVGLSDLEAYATLQYQLEFPWNVVPWHIGEPYELPPGLEHLEGQVAFQSPPAGTLVDPATVVTVRFGVLPEEATPPNTAPSSSTTSTTEPVGTETVIAFSFPPEVRSPWVSVSITGGHGSVHHIGDPVTVCVSWEALPGEPPGRWELWDYQPPDAAGLMHQNGSMYFAGSECDSTATIGGPAGYERIRIVALEWDEPTGTRSLKDYAELWIYVEE